MFFFFKNNVLFIQLDFVMYSLCNLYLSIMLSWLHSLFLNLLAAAFYVESASSL